MLLGLPNFLKDGLSPIKLTETQQIKGVEIASKAPFYYHIDGEPRECKEGKLKIAVKPKSLKIIF